MQTIDKPKRVYPPETFDERSDMPPEYRAAVVKLICETGELGSTDWHRAVMAKMAAWVDLAPTLADRVRMAEFFADEMRHGYIFENLLLSLGEKPDAHVGTSIEGLHLAEGITRWEEVVLLTTLLDRAASLQFNDYKRSSYAPLAHIAPSMSMDEQGHATTGLVHLTELVETPEGRVVAQRELERWWPIALDMFGTSTGAKQFRYIEWGLREDTNEELRQTYIAHTRPVLADLGLEAPDDMANRKFL